MIPEFSFTRTPHIIFGPGKFNDLNRLVGRFGKSVLVVTGSNSLKSSGKLDNLVESFNASSLHISHFTIQGEPSPELIDQAVTEFRDRKIDAVLSIGGGSVMDAGKAISAMMPQNDSIMNYLEDIGDQSHNGVKLPFIAVPTTAGTGTEATKNAVISRIGERGFKKSLRHDNFIPDMAVVDPELTLCCPLNVTAACGMDAFTQLLESYVSIKATHLTDALALSGLTFLKDNLISACTTGASQTRVRAGMSYASLLSGITLANAGLGIVHGLASPMGGFFDIPHGVVCGTLIGTATRMNIESLLKNQPQGNDALRKYADIGRLFSGNQDVNIEDACRSLTETIDAWTDQLQMPHLSKYGIVTKDIDKIAHQTGNKNNPVRLNAQEIRKILLSRI